MSTDRELLELASKAAGEELKYDSFGQSENADRVYCYWNPLVDDSDAFRLAASLELDVSFGLGGAVVTFHGNEQTVVLDDDYLAATRRAITTAAAEIGKAKEDK